MRLLANENIPLPSTCLLRQAGYDITAITEDSPGIPDTMVLGLAADAQRIILTFDRDYGELIYRKRLRLPGGLIYLRFQPQTPTEPAEILMNLFQSGNFEFEQRFAVISRDQIRQRNFPV
jgi:predicted nuclease of predicted toxin-antitoxin system